MLPWPNVTMERYNFNSCLCNKGESISNYVAELRQLTEHCDFGVILEDMLRDRLFFVVSRITIQIEKEALGLV